MDDTAPKLDPRSVDDLVAQTEALAAAYSGWRPPADGAPLDFGGALVQLFARMVDQLVKRLNQVPRKHHLAFVDLLGAVRTPPRPARAPITFHLTDGSVGDAEVPAGTQVAAATPDGEITFETELPLALTRAQLRGVFVRDPAHGSYFDATAIATGAAPGPFDALAASRPVEHELYLASDLLSLAGVTQVVLLVDGKGKPMPAQPIAWSAWSNGQWTALAALTASASAWQLTADPTKVGAVAVNGVVARWLRGSVPLAPPAVQLTATVTLNGLVPLPDAAFFNQQPLDVTGDHRPFGDRPRLGDTFYLGSDAAFAVDGATVTLGVKLSPGTVQPSGDLALQWEGWDGARPTVLTVQDGTAKLTAAGNLVVTLKSAIPRATVGGVTSRWIRARIVAGNYGTDASVSGTYPNITVTPASFHPPQVASISLGWTGSRSAPPSACLRRTDLTYDDLGADAQAGPVTVYLPIADATPALYLGFDRPFEPRLTTLYLQVFPPPAPDPATFGQDPPPRNPPALDWQYWNGGWAALPVEDGSAGLLRSGLVRFLAPTDAQPLSQFGTSQYWICVRARDLTFSPMPEVGLILTNTVWASHALTSTRESLGASNGGRSQLFKVSQAPVLAGQQIEVGEPEPPPEELARLAEAEADPLTVEDDPTGGAPTFWVRWHAVPDFWGSGPRDRHYTFDAETGEVTFGDGHRGLIPPAGLHNVRAAWYRSGGGSGGNLPARALTQLKTTLPLVDAAVNPEEASGGATIEPEAALLERASRTIRHGGRAVTAQDFADLALEASTAVARAVTLTPSFSPIDQADSPKTGPDDLHRDGEVVVVVVPAAPRPGRAPTVDVLASVEDYLRARAAPGATVKVTGPDWVAVDVTAHVIPRSQEIAEQVRQQVRAEIVRLFDPLVGGDGRGWDFGRRPRASDLAARITAVAGVDHIAALTVKCDPPFDLDDTTQDVNISIDAQSLFARILVYPRAIAVNTALVAAAKVQR
jgi:hypothetical protein